MSYTVYSSIEDMETGEEVVSEYRNYADYDAACAAADDLVDDLEKDAMGWVSTWVEDEHGNQRNYYSARESWEGIMDTFTEDPGY